MALKTKDEAQARLLLDKSYEQAKARPGTESSLAGWAFAQG